MIGLLIVSHSELSKGFKEATEMIMGPQENLEYIGFNNGDSLEDLLTNIKKVTDNYRERKIKFAILTDIVSGTPFNKVLEAEIGKNTIVISGMNLPLILELLTLSFQENFNFEKEVENILEKSRNSMKVFNTKDLKK